MTPDLDDLRALLSIDRTELGRLADMRPDVDAAREAWRALPYAVERHTANTIGFGAWYRQWKAGRTK